MKTFISALALVFSLNTFAAKISVGFTTNSAPVAFGTPAEFLEAQAAFEARYATEDGFVRTQPSVGGALIVVMTHPRFVNRLWDKMQRVGNGGYEGRAAYFYFNTSTTPTSPVVQYDWMRSIALSEGARGYVQVTNAAATVTGYIVRIHRSCAIANSGVDLSNINDRIAPTRLMGTTRQADQIVYQYSVNGGAGAQIRGISVDLARPRTPFFFNNCQVDVGLQYAP